MQQATHTASAVVPEPSSLNVPTRSRTAPLTSAPTSRALQPGLTISVAKPSLEIPSRPIRSSSAILPDINSSSGTSSIAVPFRPNPQHYTPAPSSNKSLPQQVSIQTYGQSPLLPASRQASLTNETFSDLISLQTPSQNSSLPLQTLQGSTYQSNIAQLGGTNFSAPTFVNSPFTNLGYNASTPASNFASVDQLSVRSASLPMYTHGTGIAAPSGVYASNMQLDAYGQTFGPQLTPSPLLPDSSGVQGMTGGFATTPSPSLAPYPTQNQFAMTSNAVQMPLNTSNPTMLPGYPSASSPRAQQAQQFFQSISNSKNPFQ